MIIKKNVKNMAKRNGIEEICIFRKKKLAKSQLLKV